MREARNCHPPEAVCEGDYDEPFYQYDHGDGQSVTGGYVAHRPPTLAGRYLFGDYATGRIWALTPPASAEQPVDAVALGRFPFRISTFGRDASGTVYVGSHNEGTVYRVESP